VIHPFVLTHNYHYLTLIENFIDVLFVLISALMYPPFNLMIVALHIFISCRVRLSPLIKYPYCH
jgi:hypothetical protein